MAMKSRTNKRSRSGASEKCPHCGKLLRGQKGLTAHVKNEHANGAKEAKS